MNPVQVPEIQTLKSLPLEDRSELPKISAIYLVIDEASEVIYVGMSQNIWQRWASTKHHKYQDAKFIKNCRISWIPCEPDLLRKVESALIDYFKPRLNRQCGNPNITDHSFEKKHDWDEPCTEKMTIRLPPSMKQAIKDKKIKDWQEICRRAIAKELGWDMPEDAVEESSQNQSH